MKSQKDDSRAVYREVLRLSLPIALQNIFSTAVSSADVVMVGFVGQDALSAVSLAGQIQFVLNLIQGVIGGLFILLASPLFFHAAELTEQAVSYLQTMLFINAAYVLTVALNTTLNNGVFCAGGDTRFGLICDTIDMWLFSVPLGFINAFVLKLPPMTVYFFLCCDELAKLPFMYRHYKSHKWAENITRETEELKA